MPKWSGTESNRRHGDFQSPALPTELPDHLRKQRHQQVNPLTHWQRGEFTANRLAGQSGTASQPPVSIIGLPGDDRVRLTVPSRTFTIETLLEGDPYV